MHKFGAMEPVKRTNTTATAVISDYDALKKHLEAHLKIYSPATSIITSNIKQIPGNRPTYLYRILVTIASLDKPCEFNIRKAIKGNSVSILSAVNSLQQEGYIKMIKKPRLIHQLNRIKLEKAYILTPKGKQVLCKIISPLFPKV